MSSADSPRFVVSTLAAPITRPTMQQLAPFARDAALFFVPDRLLDPGVATGIANALDRMDSPPLVFLEGALRADVLDALATDLAAASFLPHHHAPYPLHVAPHASLDSKTMLGKFVAWLKSPAAAAYHVSLAGLSSLPRSISSAWIQVQVARMTTGQSFPVHIDTDEEGLTCVYQFTRDYDDSDGGRLFFGQDEQTAEFLLSPAFGSLLLFCPKGAPHGVSPVRAPVERPRFTITAFYLYGKE